MCGFFAQSAVSRGLCFCECVWGFVWVCVAQANTRELTSPDNSLCLRMASFIRSYVTSSVQFTRAFLVMLGNVPEGNGYFNHY